MPTVEALLLLTIVIVGVVVLAKVRQTRGQRDLGPPFGLGPYGGCAVLIVVLAAAMWIWLLFATVIAASPG